MDEDEDDDDEIADDDDVDRLLSKQNGRIDLGMSKNCQHAAAAQG